MRSFNFRLIGQLRFVVLLVAIFFIHSFSQAQSPGNDSCHNALTITLGGSGYGIGYTNIRCQIYNRWGEKLLDSDDFSSWDGTYQGVPVQSGIYIYQMIFTDYQNVRHFRKGTIQVIR